MRGALRSAYWALVLIGIGVILLLRNAHHWPRDVRILPLVLVAAGLWLLLERLGNRWGKAGGLFVPLVLIGLGAVMVLQDTGVIPSDVSLWPVVLIALGLALLANAIPVARRGPADRTEERVPLEGATSGRVKLEYSAGKLVVGSTSSIGVLLEGTFVGPAESEVRRDGDRLEVRLRPRRRWRPPPGPRAEWSVWLSRAVPLSLAFRIGAARSDIDLAEVRAEEVDLETGASQTTLTVPGRGHSAVRVHGGAADLTIRVPPGVSARIRTRTGMSSVRVDPRFPRDAGGYRSADFDTAPNRVELDIDVGAASVRVS